MDELVQYLRECLANTFIMYFKAHQYHWNIEGPNFPQYHDFLGNLYEELHGAVDPIAEQIRTLDQYAPTSIAAMLAMGAVVENLVNGQPREMFTTLNNDNNILLLTLTKAYEKAEELGQLGIANFLQDRLTAHEKHGWMLRATAKNA